MTNLKQTDDTLEPEVEYADRGPWRPTVPREKTHKAMTFGMGPILVADDATAAERLATTLLSKARRLVIGAIWLVVLVSVAAGGVAAVRGFQAHQAAEAKTGRCVFAIHEGVVILRAQNRASDEPPWTEWKNIPEIQRGIQWANEHPAEFAEIDTVGVNKYGDEVEAEYKDWCKAHA